MFIHRETYIKYIIGHAFLSERTELYEDLLLWKVSLPNIGYQVICYAGT